MLHAAFLLCIAEQLHLFPCYPPRKTSSPSGFRLICRMNSGTRTLSVCMQTQCTPSYGSAAWRRVVLAHRHSFAVLGNHGSVSPWRVRESLNMSTMRFLFVNAGTSKTWQKSIDKLKISSANTEWKTWKQPTTTNKCLRNKNPSV